MSSPTRARRLPGFENVAANATATLRIPLGATYHVVSIVTSNPVSSFSQIRVKVNGGTVQEYTGTQLAALNQFYRAGGADTGNVAHIWFDAPWLRTRNGREFGAIGAGPPSESNPRPVQTFAIEVDLDGTAAPNISAFAKVSPPSPSGLIRKIRRFSLNAGGGGDYEISDIPTADGITAIHLQKAAADITAARVVADSFDLFDRTVGLNNDYLSNTAHLERVPQAGYFHIDPREDGDAGEGFAPALAEDFRIIPKVSTGGAIVMLVEQIGEIPV